MKRKTVFLVLAVIAIACSYSGETPKKKQPTDEQISKEEALNLLHKWTDAYLKGDAVPLNEIIDDSWIYSGSSDGTTSNKMETIEEFSNADYTFQDITYQGLDVRLYGDVAIVRGSESMIIVGASGSDTTVLNLRFTDVYQKKDGIVQAISTHSSPIMND